jgi:TPR repeat protein
MSKRKSLQKLEDKANSGDAQAQFYLSVIHEDGRGVAPDLSKAAHWCIMAARSGDRQSQYRLSKMLEIGRGFEKRHERAAWYWLEKAASQGHTQAQFELGLRYLFGVIGVRKSLYKAKRWLSAAAGGEHSEAKYYLGFMYQHGLGLVESQETAFELFAESAQLGCPKAQCSLAFMYEHGISCKKNINLSRHYYEKSASAGHVGAQFGLACLALSCGQHNDAIIWFDIAANNGVAPAQAILAKLYTSGIGTTRDLVAALTWCLIVENTDDVDAESLETVRECHRSIATSAQQRQIDAAYTRACKWLSRRNELPLPVEIDWNEQIKKEIDAYEKRSKRWT